MIMAFRKKKFKSDEQRKAVMAKYNEPKQPARLQYLGGEQTSSDPIPGWLRDDKPSTTTHVSTTPKPYSPATSKSGESGTPGRRGPKPTKSLGTTKRTIDLSFYVPATRDVDKPITEGEFKQRIDETQAYMRQTFGGTTTVQGVGTWTGDNNRIVEEQVAIVTTAIEPKDYRNHKAEFVEYTKEKKEQWGQEAITVKMEDSQHHRKEEGTHFVE